MKIFGSEDLANKEVFNDVKKYMERVLPEYDVIMVVRASDSPLDDYLYMVEGKRKREESDEYGGNYACWTCWNESTKSLAWGHYDLESERDALEILSDMYHECYES